MHLAEIRERFAPVIDELLDLCQIDDGIVDMEKLQIYIATIWGNAVLQPERSGITEADLEALHDYLNEEITGLMGEGSSVKSCYEFIISKKGEDSLTRNNIPKHHREFLHHFAGLILQRGPRN